jgi:hypothetical protein
MMLKVVHNKSKLVIVKLDIRQILKLSRQGWDQRGVWSKEEEISSNNVLSDFKEEGKFKASLLDSGLKGGVK